MNADALYHWLMRTSLEASILILAVLGLRLMLGIRLSPAWRIGLWMLVGAKLMLPAFIPAGFGIGGWMAASEAPSAMTEKVADEWGQADGFTSVPSVSNGGISISHSPAPIRLPESASSAISLREASLALWLLGVLVVFAAALYRQHRFHGFLRRRPQSTAPLLRALVASLSRKAGLKRQVNIVLMPAGTTPAMVGIRQPTLLLPEDWETRFDESSLRHVVLHELLHVKQHDLAWNWAATAVQALHWFNPLVWFVVSRFQADRELRCDAGALAILAPWERLDYGHTLLRIQETFFAPPAIAGLAPCVRNHPTLRQRILMIAQPTTRQPWVHALLVLTLGVLVSYSFTTARAAEKEVPAKVREGAANRSAETEKPRKGEAGEDGKPMREGERERDGVKKTGDRDGEGGKKTGDRDGEGGKKAGDRDGEGMKKPGARDGEGGVKKPARDGEGEGGKKPGMRDGEKPRTGERDGEKPRSGARDGEGGVKTGPREGEGGKKPGAREGEGSIKVRKGEGESASASSGEVITLHVTAGGDTVIINEEKIAMNRLRGHLSNFLSQHPSSKVIVSGDADVPLGALHNTVDAVRDNGNKNVGIKAE
ncbi:MAG: M56 family metallopeptidase [Verrucomicrobiota bacterium]